MKKVSNDKFECTKIDGEIETWTRRWLSYEFYVYNLAVFETHNIYKFNKSFYLGESLRGEVPQFSDTAKAFEPDFSVTGELTGCVTFPIGGKDLYLLRLGRLPKKLSRISSSVFFLSEKDETPSHPLQLDSSIYFEAYEHNKDGALSESDWENMEVSLKVPVLTFKKIAKQLFLLSNPAIKISCKVDAYTQNDYSESEIGLFKSHNSEEISIGRAGLVIEKLTVMENTRQKGYPPPGSTAYENDRPEEEERDDTPIQQVSVTNLPSISSEPIVMAFWFIVVLLIFIASK